MNRHGTAVVTLPSDTEIEITRRFDAPAKLVFEAMAIPELVKRWWGYEGFEWVTCDIDLRVGGSWRYHARHEGMDVAFHGEYREVDAPRRVVYTEVYEGAPEAGAGVNTVTLDEADGVTTMTIVSEYPSREVRDLVIDSGMESGMQVSYDRLEDLVRDAA
jgi:uncharacterized protein YndB with AHSA1/START domain